MTRFPRSAPLAAAVEAVVPGTAGAAQPDAFTGGATARSPGALHVIGRPDPTPGGARVDG